MTPKTVHLEFLIKDWNILLIADDELLFDLPEEGFQDEGFEDIVEGEYTNGQGFRNGYNLIDRSSVSSNFCGINKDL